MILSIILTLQFSSVAQSCPTLCDPMNRSTPGLPVHQQLPEFTQNLLLINKNLVQICAPHRPSVGNPPTSPLPEETQPLPALTYSQDKEGKTSHQLRTGSNLLTPGGQDSEVFHSVPQIFDQIPWAPRSLTLVLLQDPSSLAQLL